MTVYLYLLVYVVVLPGLGHSKLFKIGAVFEKVGPLSQDLEDSGHALLTAVRDINWENDDENKFEASIKYITPGDAFGAMQAACDLIEEGVIGILGPKSDESASVVQSICDAKEIPYIETRWNDHIIDGIGMNVYPDPEVLTRTYRDVLESRNWDRFVILYEDNTSLRRVIKLIDFLNMTQHRILLRQLDPDQSGIYRDILRELRKSGETHFFLDCSIEILKDVLEQVQQVGLITSNQNFIITNFDFHTLDLRHFQYAEANVTAMRFVDPDDEFISKVAARIVSGNEKVLYEDPVFMLTAGWKLRLEPALIYDAVLIFTKIVRSIAPRIAPPERSYCNDPAPAWIFGQTIVNLIKGYEYSDDSEKTHEQPVLSQLTGRIEFDAKGLRSKFALDIVELRLGGIAKVGSWDAFGKLEVLNEGDENHLINKHFKVYVTLTEPYVMLKATPDNLKGNDRFEGFGVDLIKELSQICGFNYTFEIQKDNEIGEFNSTTKKWSGMIRDIIFSKPEENVLAISDLTITQEREKAVDFTSPFMFLGISILYERPQKAPPGFFSFADPLALEVWKLLCAAYFGVSTILFILARICPAEWTNPFPCIEEPEYLINTLSLRNCFWFNIGALMQQGSEIAPVAIPTRMVAGMWWFFTLIMVSSYTANLAAFLTIETSDPHFNDLHELLQNADEKHIQYGAKAGGATFNFFRDSKNNSEHQEIWDYMTKHPELMMKNNKMGVAKAEKGKYAFFMESTSIEYETERHCNLVKVGGQITEKVYGIAMRKNATYRNELSMGVLKLQESGTLNDLKTKWWQQRRGGGQCPDQDQDSEATPLDLKNVGGVFWVTIIGTILAIFLVFIEFILYVARESAKTKTSFKMALTKELKFYFKSTSMVKPVVYNQPSEESCSSKMKSEEKEPVQKQDSTDSARSRSHPRSSKSAKSRRDNNMPLDIGFI